MHIYAREERHAYLLYARGEACKGRTKSSPKVMKESSPPPSGRTTDTPAVRESKCDSSTRTSARVTRVRNTVHPRILGLCFTNKFPYELRTYFKRTYYVWGKFTQRYYAFKVGTELVLFRALYAKYPYYFAGSFAQRRAALAPRPAPQGRHADVPVAVHLPTLQPRISVNSSLCI